MIFTARPHLYCMHILPRVAHNLYRVKGGSGPKMSKKQKIKQLQFANSDSDSEDMPIDILDEEL